MTSKERILAAINGQRADRIPLTTWCFGFPAPKHLQWETNGHPVLYWYSKRLEHIQTTGLQWSGAVTNNGEAVLVSNLGNSTVWFNMPNAQFKDKLISGFYIGAGEHRLETFQVPEPAIMTLLLSGAVVWLLRLGKSARGRSFRSIVFAARRSVCDAYRMAP